MPRIVLRRLLEQYNALATDLLRNQAKTKTVKDIPLPFFFRMTGLEINFLANHVSNLSFVVSTFLVIELSNR